MNGTAARAAEAQRLFLGLLGCTLANVAFNALAIARGWPFPYTNFLADAKDAFADFLKFTLSYPGGERIRPSNLLGLHDLIVSYIQSTDYRDVTGLGLSGPEHLHVTPLTTVFSLLSLRAMRWIDPVALFLLLTAAIILYWHRIARWAAAGAEEARAWSAFGLIAFPMLFMVDRGNLPAGLTGLLLVQSLLLAQKRRAPLVAALLMAVALNLRPNAALCAVVPLAFYGAGRWRFAGMLTGASALLFGGSLLAATALYPHYGFAAFLHGLRAYHDYYALHAAGLAGGSSLYGALRLAFGSVPAFEPIATVVAVVPLAGGILLWSSGRVPDAVLLFVTIAAYVLGSTVFADYHLIVLLAVPLAIVTGADRMARDMRLVMLAASLFVLAPKNYAFADGVSWQAALNPMVLLAGSAVVLALALRLPRPAWPAATAPGRA